MNNTIFSTNLCIFKGIYDFIALFACFFYQLHAVQNVDYPARGINIGLCSFGKFI